MSLNFTAIERGDGNVAVRDMTASVTHYRVRELQTSPDELLAQAWIPVTARRTEPKSLWRIKSVEVPGPTSGRMVTTGSE